MKEPTRPDGRRTRRGVRIAVGVAGVALAAATGAAWMFRVPLADSAARDALAGMGLDTDFEIADVGLGGATVRNLRLGAENAPDFTAARADLQLGWGLTGPKLTGVRLLAPAIRVSLSAKGFSFGALDKVKTGGKSSGELPAMLVEIVDGRALVSTPYGVLPATFSSHGRLTRDFTAALDMAPTIVSSPRGRIEGARLAVRARTEAGSLRVDGNAGLDGLRAPGSEAEAVVFNLSAAVPRRLSGATASARASAARAVFQDETAHDLSLELGAEPGAERRWRVRAVAKAGRLEGDALNGDTLQLSLNALGDASAATGQWTVRTDALGAARLAMQRAHAEGDFAFRASDEGEAVLSATGAANLPEAGLDGRGRRALLDATPSLAGSPLGGLFSSGRAGLDRALQKFSTATTVRLDWRNGSGRLALPGPVRLESESGATITATPAEGGRPVLLILLPSGGVEGAVRLTMAGGDLPPATLSLTRYGYSAEKLEAEGALRVADWRAAGGRLDLADTRFVLKGAQGRGDFSMDGAVALDGATGAVRLRDLRLPLRLDAHWGGGYRITMRDGCAPIDQGEIGLPGHVLNGQRVTLCPGRDGVLMGADASGRMLGGFSIDNPSFSGRTDDAARRRVSFAAQRIDATFTGGRGDSHLEIAARLPAYAIDYAADRHIRFAGEVFTARTESGGRVGGAFRGGVFEDPTTPANVTQISARWSSTPEGRRNVVRISDGVATLTDKRPADDARAEQLARTDAPVTPETAAALTSGHATAEAQAPAPDWKPRFNPMRIAGLHGTLVGSEIDAEGVVDLIDGGRRLAALTIHHDLKTGAGVADIDNPALVFDKKLDLYEITELARGVVDGVTGPVGLDLQATWNSGGIVTGGHVRLNDVNLNALALGPVSGLSGDVEFNDLAALTTPPGQTLRVGKLNPGVVVENGVITFQMLAADRMKMESASWPFAGGTLSVDPQIVQIGEDTFRMTLTLRGVDVARFLKQLDLKDLTATGTVEGSFPLIFDRNGGAIDGVGILRAAAGGGTITYTGNAGSGLAGAPQIAFEALRSFRYDDLVLELSGKLDGDLVTDIRFTGTNQEPVDVVTGPVAAPIPGLGRIRATGLPFRFTVSVRAPFRRLMQTSDSINDARTILEDAVRNGQTTGEPAPQEPATDGTATDRRVDPATQPPN